MPSCYHLRVLSKQTISVKPRIPQFSLQCRPVALASRRGVQRLFIMSTLQTHHYNDIYNLSFEAVVNSSCVFAYSFLMWTRTTLQKWDLTFPQSNLRLIGLLDSFKASCTVVVASPLHHQGHLFLHQPTRIPMMSTPHAC